MMSSLVQKVWSVLLPSLDRANYSEKLPGCLIFDASKAGKRCFDSIEYFVEKEVLIPWRDSQDEFIVFTRHKGDCCNPINWLSILSALAFKVRETACLEEIESAAVHYQHHPNAGFLMNNLGVMFSEIVSYEKSLRCFTISKECFALEKDDVMTAVATVNLAALHTVLGEYKKAHSFCVFAADLCHDISMREIEEVQIPEKLLRSVAYLLEKLEDYKKFYCILKVGALFNIVGTCNTSEVNLTKWLMEIQLEEQNGEKIKAKELGNLTSYLLAVMDEPVVAILNAEFVRTVMTASEINQKTGHFEEACKLVEKLEATFWRNDYPRNGSTLLQIGHFKVGVGKFIEAKSTLKQAERVLIHCFGNSHHTVGLCKISMGTCAMLTNNAKDALKHLNEALSLFEKLNGYHPKIAEILLKLAFLYVDEGSFQSAKNATKKAMDIFISSCGYISRKTALGYFQVVMILQKVDEFKALAVDNLKKAIEIFCNLGLRPNHPDIMLCQSLLGVLHQSLGKSKEAEKCFDDVQKQASLMEESCSTKAKLISCEFYDLFVQVKADHGMGRCLSLTAQVISLVNLVHIKTNDDRQKCLNSLVSCLEENHTEFPEVWNFGGNNVLYVCQKTFITGKVVYFVLSMGQKQNSTQFEDDNRDSNMMMLSRKKSSSCLLFWRSSCSIQEMKEFKHLEHALRESVTTLFLQPKFRKVYDEGKDFYIELTMPTELGENSSLCMKIDLIPLLTELKVAESDKETVGFECLTSWSSSSVSKPSVHVSYFSYKFSNKRVAEFAFDHLIASLGEDLVLQKLQVVEISSAPTLKNIAFSPFQELSPSSLSIVVDSELPVLTVKCRTLKESGSNCICFSVQSSLENAMKALHELFQVDFETSVKMFCDGVRVGSYKQSASSNSSLDVKPEMSYPSTASETVDSMTSASTRNLESGLKRKQSVEAFHNWVPEELPPVSHCRDKLHAGVNVCLCLLDCLLGNRNFIPDIPEEEVLDSNAVSSSPYPSCDSSIHPDCSESLLSASSASSLNLQPVSPCKNFERGPFMPNKLSSESFSSVGARMENNCLNYALPLADQRETEQVTCSKQLLENSSKQSTEHSGLHEEFPEKLLPSSEGLNLSSCEEGLTTGEGNPDSEAKEPDFIADSHHIQPVSSNKEPPSNLYHKGDTHVESKVVHCRELQSVQCHTVQVNPRQTAAWESVTQPSLSSTSVSQSSGAGTLLNESGGPTFPRDDELAALHHQLHELQEYANQLEENLKKSEAEKQQFQAELGRYLFLEDKGRRNQQLLLLSRASGSDQSRQCAGSASPALTSMDERLLGGAGPLEEPSSTLQVRLLEISDSLSEDELKRMKFLARDKVNGFRLAKIREGFELFEELETGGKYPCAYIGQLLERVQRCDLLEKLGLPFLDDAKSGSEHLTEPQASLPSTDELSGRRKKEPLTTNRTSHVSTHCEGDDGVSRSEQRDCEHNLNASGSSSGSSDVTDHEMSVGHVNSSSERLSLQNALHPGEQCPDSSDASCMSNSSCSSTVNSSDSLVRSSQTTLSNCTSQGSPYSSSSLTSSNSLSAAAASEMVSESGLNPTNSNEEIVRKSLHADNVSANGDLDEVGVSAAKNEEREEHPVDLCDGVVRTIKTDTRTCALGDGFVFDQASGTGSFGHDQSAIERHSVGVSSASSTDWERLGARPKRVQVQCPPPDPAPQEIVSPAVSDGVTGDFLARHSQDKALHESLYRDDADISLFNDTPLQGASYIDGMINSSETNKAKPYLGACQYTSGTDPYSRLGNPSLHGPSNGFGRIGLLGGFSFSENLNGNSGVATAPLPSHLGGNNFSFHGNYLSNNGLNIGNSYSLQSNFVNNGSRFTGVEHLSRDSYSPYEQRLGLASSNPGNQPVYSGMNGSGFPNYPWMGAVGYQPGPPVYSTQQSTVFSDNASTVTPRQDMRQTTQNASFTLGNQSSNTSNNAQTTSASAGNTGFVDVGNSGLPAPSSVSTCISSSSVVVSTTTSRPALACAGSGTLTVHDNDNDNNEIDDQGAAGGNAESSLAPYCSGANNDNSGGTMLNRDFGTDSVESTDNSLLALEQRVSEACALVERVLREREEREQFGREIERKEQMIREQRERERREREERELQEAERWPQQQEAITARSQWLCEHYQRHCRVRFPCCTQFYPCHRCHNNSRACDNEEAKACHATHLKCSHCQHEQEIDENSGKCAKCEGKMSAYFCSICKHFTSVDKNPYHCEKCGICRIHKDKSFHCEVCNVCLDKRLEGNHKCRPDSGHDECCICLEDAFSGCQILPCSHKVHRECAIAMIQNGIRTCPICRHPLYSQPRG